MFGCRSTHMDCGMGSSGQSQPTAADQPHLKFPQRLMLLKLAMIDTREPSRWHGSMWSTNKCAEPLDPTRRWLKALLMQLSMDLLLVQGWH